MLFIIFLLSHGFLLCCQPSHLTEPGPKYRPHCSHWCPGSSSKDQVGAPSHPRYKTIHTKTAEYNANAVNSHYPWDFSGKPKCCLALLVVFLLFFWAPFYRIQQWVLRIWLNPLGNGLYTPSVSEIVHMYDLLLPWGYYSFSRFLFIRIYHLIRSYLPLRTSHRFYKHCGRDERESSFSTPLHLLSFQLTKGTEEHTGFGATALQDLSTSL